MYKKCIFFKFVMKKYQKLNYYFQKLYLFITKMSESKKYVLILGGSAFTGLNLLKLLTEDKNNIIYIVNRGREYWNYEIK